MRTGIGASLARAGGALQDFAQTRIQTDDAIERMRIAREEDDARAWTAASLAEAQRRVVDAVRQAQTEAPDGYRNLTSTVEQRLAEIRDEYLRNAKTTSPSALRFFSERWSAYQPSVLSQAEDLEREGQVSYQVDTLARSFEDSASVIVADPTRYDVQRAESLALVESMQSLPDDRKRDLVDRMERSYSGAALSGLIDRNPRTALRELQNPEAEGIYGRLSAAQREQGIREAQAEIDRREARYRAQVMDQVQAAERLWDLGLEANSAPSVETVRNALGEDRAIAYEASRAVSEQFSGVATRPSSELLRMASNTAQPDNLRDTVVGQAQRRAAAQALEQRNEDPMGYAIRHGLAADNGLLSELQSGNWGGVYMRLRARGAAATSNSQALEMRANPLTQAEAAILNQQLSQLPSQQRGQVLQGLAQSMSGQRDAYRALLRQIAGNDPTTAYAGYTYAQRGAARIQGRNQSPITAAQAGRYILRGQELLSGGAQGEGQSGSRPRLTAMPSETDMRQAWRRNVNENAYSGLRAAEEGAYGAFRAAYVAMAQEAGLTNNTVDGALASRAAAAATGGVAVVNGRHTIMPWGMDASRFNDSLQRGWGAISRTYPDLAGASPRDFTYVLVGDGLYEMQNEGEPVMSRGRPVRVRLGDGR